MVDAAPKIVNILVPSGPLQGAIAITRAGLALYSERGGRELANVKTHPD